MQLVSEWRQNLLRDFQRKWVFVEKSGKKWEKMDATHRSNRDRGDIFVYLDKKEDNMANELVTINDQAIIDEYYRNGFIGYKAVLKVKPDVTQKWAGTYFNAMMKKPENRVYAESLVEVQRSEAQIETVQLLRELKIFAFSDITDYLDLTIEELKALPPEIRRCIGSFKMKRQRYLPRGAKPGEEVTEEIVEIKLIDKLKTIEMINKHVGFYLEDNKQKSVRIDLSKANNVQLNMLLSLAEESSK